MWKEEQYLRCATHNLTVKERINFTFIDVKSIQRPPVYITVLTVQDSLRMITIKKTRDLRFANKVNFKCQNCPHVFSTVAWLEEHNKRGCSEQTKKVFKCQVCTRHFTSELGLQRHSCCCDGEIQSQKCQKMFSSKYSLEHYFKTCVHLLVCDACHMRCQTIELLREHVATEYKD